MKNAESTVTVNVREKKQRMIFALFLLKFSFSRGEKDLSAPFISQ